MSNAFKTVYPLDFMLNSIERNPRNVIPIRIDNVIIGEFDKEGAKAELSKYPDRLFYTDFDFGKLKLVAIEVMPENIEVQYGFDGD
jgi:hypothetical protein